jgi:nucleotide-binding universal stress UspA family protein
MAIKPVIAGTNGSVASARAVAWAVQEAVQRDVPLRIVAVLPPGRHGGWLVPADPLYGALRETAVHALDEEASRAALAAPGLTVDTSLISDEAAPFLADLGLSASMLVVGTRGTARSSTGQLGPVSRYLAANARCPVVIIPSATPAPQRQVVVGVRDSDDER